MSIKVVKMWQFTIFTLLVMGAFALMGGGYLPWLITSVSMAIVADIIASRLGGNYTISILPGKL